MVAVRKDYAAPTGLKIILGWDSTNMPRLTALWAGATPKTATGTGALPSNVPAGRPMAVWGGRTGQRAFETASVFRVPWKSGGGPPHSKTLARHRGPPNRAKRLGVRQPSGALGGRDAGNGHRDGRAPQQCPSRAANGSLGWTNGAKGV